MSAGVEQNARHWDVIVVGLGPAGAAAAAVLSLGGARVLALDAGRERSKPCGGCLSLRGERALRFLEPPPRLLSHPVSRVWLSYPGRPASRFDTDATAAYFVERPLLDAWLARRAAEAGARVALERARRLSRLDGGWLVETDRQAHRARWLLGADGAGSLVGRRLELGRSGLRYLAVVEERPLTGRLAGLLAGAALLELGGAAGGYGWAFGRGGVLNAGIAGCLHLGPASGSDLRRRYAAFLKRHDLGEPGALRGAAIPCPDRWRSRLTMGTAAVLGDAAGLADPFLGEGIAQAVLSGRLAGEAVLAGDLGLYQRAMETTLLNDHGHARAISRLVYRAPGIFHGLAVRRPGGMELGFNLLRGELRPRRIWPELARGLLGLKPELDREASSYYYNPLN